MDSASKHSSSLSALAGVLAVAIVSAGCVTMISRRRSSLASATDVGSWAVRRPRAIGFVGPSNVSRPMAAIPRKENRGRPRGYGHGILIGNFSRCYSLHKPDICEGNGQRAADNSTNCTNADEDHRDARMSSRFCGDRVQRKNPCWRHDGRERCLPYFFILGEMKCGTTSLFRKITQHPQVVAPRNKEVRYLQQPRYRKLTASWYASNFDAVVSAPSTSVTLDASPTLFSAQVSG